MRLHPRHHCCGCYCHHEELKLPESAPILLGRHCRAALLTRRMSPRETLGLRPDALVLVEAGAAGLQGRATAIPTGVAGQAGERAAFSMVRFLSCPRHLWAQEAQPGPRDPVSKKLIGEESRRNGDPSTVHPSDGRLQDAGAGLNWTGPGNIAPSGQEGSSRPCRAAEGATSGPSPGHHTVLGTRGRSRHGGKGGDGVPRGALPRVLRVCGNSPSPAPIPSARRLSAPWAGDRLARCSPSRKPSFTRPAAEEHGCPGA